MFIPAINKTPRDLYILYSNFIKSIFGNDYYTAWLYNNIVNSDNDIIIIDDWRLPVETDWLHTSEVSKDIILIKIFLEKEDVVKNNLSNISNEYENLISKDSCDLALSFKHDWSNTKKLIKKVQERVLHAIV